MTLAVRAVFWVMAYLGVVVAPLVFAAIGASGPDHDFWTTFSVALGFVGLSMMGLEFALVARFKPVAAPFGQDALLQFHRQIGYVGLGVRARPRRRLGAVGIAHVRQRDLGARSGVVRHGGRARPARARGHFGLAPAAAPLLRVVARVHTALAVLAVVGALVHVYFVDEYVSTVWKQALWGLMSAAFVALLVWVRLVKPRRMRERPWRLERVGAERGQTTTLALSPPGDALFRFDPGQFAWFAFGRSPFSLTLHPFSFSSSAERDEVEIAVKALGDFTSRARELDPGTTVYVDGPHGVFSIDQDEGPGFGFIAGGVGVTGLLSMLRTMADREDVRPAVLVYANGDWESVAFRDELARLQGRMNLKVVHALERPPANWTGETGHVTAELLARHLPRGHRRFQFFICGPGPMMDAAEAALVELGIPAERVHTERFDMV